MFHAYEKKKKAVKKQKRQSLLVGLFTLRLSKLFKKEKKTHPWGFSRMFCKFHGDVPIFFLKLREKVMLALFYHQLAVKICIELIIKILMASPSHCVPLFPLISLKTMPTILRRFIFSRRESAVYRKRVSTLLHFRVFFFFHTQNSIKFCFVFFILFYFILILILVLKLAIPSFRKHLDSTVSRLRIVHRLISRIFSVIENLRLFKIF